MYKEYFRLKHMPFSIAPDPLYLYMSEGHREALAHLLYGIRSEGGFVLLTGEVGTGKTTVCRCLLEQLPDTVDVAFILNPKLSTEELLANICEELGICYPEGAHGTKVYVDALNNYLLESFGKGRKAVLIIEEAQNLSSDLLEQVRLLTNLETNESKLLQIIMIGQPELREKLALPELRQLAQRITARYHLGPLTKKEIPSYVAHRLQVAGGLGTLFEPGTMSRLYRLSGGIPRLVNIICDRALLGAYVKGKDRIDGRILRNAAREVLGGSGNYEYQPVIKRYTTPAVAAFLFLAAIFTAFSISNLNNKDANERIISAYAPPWLPPELTVSAHEASAMKIVEAKRLYSDAKSPDASSAEKKVRKKHQKKLSAKKPKPIHDESAGLNAVRNKPSDEENNAVQDSETRVQSELKQKEQ
jgi:type II secretory pathway predicted ATPase ExeA